MHISANISYLSTDEALALADCSDLSSLVAAAGRMRDEGHGNVVTYSRKVFIPLTHLCRNSCHYCTFAHPPRANEALYMTLEEVDSIVAKAQALGCTEALFTLGDKPELRYARASRELEVFGCETTLDYLNIAAKRVLDKSTLLPHLNPGVMDRSAMNALRAVSVSMGLMLETVSDRLSMRGGPHFGSPDKAPTIRLKQIEQAGELNIPFTTGLLIGIGESRRERIESLLALRSLHDRFGHVQEIIIQPFRAKPGTRMEHAPNASDVELVWTIAVARLVFGATANIQTPPNLSPNLTEQVVAAGINDWGGISPLTADFVNPEAPWPHIDDLAQQMRAIGRTLVQRLPLYPSYLATIDRWTAPSTRKAIIRGADSEGYARQCDWSPGSDIVSPVSPRVSGGGVNAVLDRLLRAATAGEALAANDIALLFSARDGAFDDICSAADSLRERTSGRTIRYVVNRNINYTNVCSYRCAFCAFSKGKAAVHLRGPAYDLDSSEIMRRVTEAWDRGATEVCMQGGIHPDYTGATYLQILRTVKTAQPAMHVHAFSPLEVNHGAETLGLAVSDFLAQLRDAGLGSLPGTAAEILDDDIRAVICPDKINTARWLSTVEAAHRVGLRTTATMMFGHVERPIHWANHLLAIRRLQERTGGFTEFVPLPFVHMEAPIYFKGLARRGPTWRETVLVHAIARLTLHPAIENIQTSWVKLGSIGAAACLQAGANDLGGTLMNESISRAAGASHGQELAPAAMDELINSIGRTPEQRTTFYRAPPAAQILRSYEDRLLTPVVQTPLQRRTRQHIHGTTLST